MFKRHLLGVLLTGALVSHGAAFGQETIDRRAAVDANAYIRIVSMAGSVVVEGWDRDSVVVTGTVESGRFDMGSAGSSAKMFVSADDENVPAPAHLLVRVPAGATIWVKTQSASIEVRGVSGGVDALSVTGWVEIRGQLRQLYAESMGGDIVLDASATSVRAKNAAGSIRFRGETRNLTLSTVSGEIDVTAPPLDRGRFETVTGTIRFRGAPERGGSLGFETHSGAIELALPSDLSTDVEISTVKGTVSNEFGRGGSTSATGLRGSERFEVGSGGAELVIGTFSGAITITRTAVSGLRR